MIAYPQQKAGPWPTRQYDTARSIQRAERRRGLVSHRQQRNALKRARGVACQP